MKKALILLIILVLFTGCGKNDKDNLVKKFSDKVNNAKTYELDGTMSIIGDEEEFNYNLSVKYKDSENYLVNLYNTDNDNEQIILKNKEGIYVISLSLNRSFKFDSSWPNNSSQSYLLKPLLNDLINDDKLVLKTFKNGYSFKAKVNYPNNEELTYEEILFNKKGNLKKVTVYDNEDVERIIVNINKIKFNTNIDDAEFSLNKYIENKPSCSGEACEKTTSNVLEDIIYPLYLPSETYLTNSETIDNEGKTRVILTFAGKKDFTIVEEALSPSDKFEVIPVFGEPIILNDTLGVIETNAVSWQKGNVSYYLTSNSLTSSEMATIASSMNLAKSVIGSK